MQQVENTKYSLLGATTLLLLLLLLLYYNYYYYGGDFPLQQRTLILVDSRNIVAWITSRNCFPEEISLYGASDDDAHQCTWDRGDIVTLTGGLNLHRWAFPWLAVNGVFAELAVFNRYMPEHKKLSSRKILSNSKYFLVYVYLQGLWDSFISIRTTVWLLLFLNCVSCVARVVWRVTIWEHSIVILLCTFTGGIVGILSLLRFILGNFISTA